MKNIFKTILALAALFVSVPGLFAQIAPDVYTEDPEHPGFVYSKQPEGPNSKGEYTIYLKSFMTGTVTESTKHIASEIVLVLDVSGSMARKMDGSRNPDDSSPNQNNWSKLKILKEAVKQFINNVNNDATAHGVNNRIALVKFANDEWYSSGGTTYARNNATPTGNHKNSSNENYTEIVNGFTSVNTTSGVSTLTTSVNALTTGGPTAVDYGIYKARALMRTLYEAPDAGWTDTTTDPTQLDETNKIIIVFTDGEPNHGNGFDNTVATTAISTVKPLKNWTAFTDQDLGVSGKVKVYTIGTFGTKPAENSDIDKYMNRVSSNYPNATGMGNNQAGTGNRNAGYYILANSAQALIDAFNKISADIATPAFVIRDNAASVVDIVSKSYSIPTGGDASQVKVYTAPCTGSTGAGNTKYTFSRNISDWTPQNPTDIGLSVDATAGTITVSKFKFTDSENIVAKKTNNTFQGNQLIIEIPIIMSEGATGGQSIQTNAPGSGLTYTDKDGNQQTISFVSPTIHLPINLEIQKRGLAKGESAKFKILRKWNGADADKPTDIDANTWYDYTSIFVTRTADNQTGDNSPSGFVVGLDPNYLYKIEEEEWGWSYVLSEVYGFNNVNGQANPVRYSFPDKSNVTSDQLNLNPFIFVNTKKENLDKAVHHAESIVTNDFQTGTTTAKAGTTVNSKPQP